MSVGGVNNVIAYASDGVTPGWAVPYYFFAFTDLVVQQIDGSGNVTNLVFGTAWTGSGTPDDYGAYPNGGSVNFLPGFIPPAAYSIVITRHTAELQPVGFIDNDPLSASVLNHALDRLTLMVQDNTENGFLGVLAGPPASGIAGQWFIVTPFQPGGVMFMVCTATGTPGTWNPTAIISL